MPKLYTARGATRLSVALLIAIISVIVYSCRKELIKSQNDASLTISNPDVQAAHDWYVTAYPIATDQITKQNIESFKQDRMLNWNKTFSPYWNKAQAFISKKGLNIVEAPALKSGDMAFASKVPANLSSFDFAKSQSLTSLIIVKQQGQYGVYAMTVYGDSTYLKGDYSKLKNNTYRTKDKDFTGWVFYHSMNGTFINGWRYINGLVVSAVYQQATAPAQTGPAVQSVKKVNLLISCDEILMTEMMETCSYYSWDTDMQYAFDCYTWANTANSYTYTLCFPNYGGGSGSNNTLNYCTVSGTNAVVKKNVNVVQTPPDDGGDPDNSNNGSGGNDSGINNSTPPSDPNGEITPPPPCTIGATQPSNQDLANITNNVQNPCLKNMVNATINGNITTVINTMIQNIFGKSDRINLSFADSMTLPSGVYGYTPPVLADANHVYNETVNLNSSILPNCSQEFIAITIMHESLHAYLTTIGSLGEYQHEAIMTTFVTQMAVDLKQMFPNISELDAKNLALSGLDATTEFKATIAKDMNLDGAYLATFSAYTVGPAGTRCH